MDVSSLGEFELISRLTRNLTQHPGELGVGDDCAILDVSGPQLLLATCDSQVDGIHFASSIVAPESIGRKALAVNLSDIAAMGGIPRYALISLMLPPHLPLALLEEIYAGLRLEANAYDVQVMGGNITGVGSSGALVIDITLLGTVERGKALLRSGARVGDSLCVTGTLGGSAAGLQTLLHPTMAAYPSEALSVVRELHTLPTPRIHEGRILSRFGPEVVTAVLDISDGLSGDFRHLCERSHVGGCIDLAQIPLAPQTRLIASALQCDPLDWALHGGEDYELLFTVLPEAVDEVCALLAVESGTPVTKIGTILPQEAGMRLRTSTGEETALTVQSWDHMQRHE